MSRTTRGRAYIVLVAFLVFAISACGTAGGGSGAGPRIGVALSSSGDAFIASARKSLEAAAERKAKLSILDGQRRQAYQDEQVDAFCADQAKAIIVNPVEPSAMGRLAAKADAAGVPVVFISRDAASLLGSSPKNAYFVGVRSEEAIERQVQILAEFWKAHSSADKNRDGIVEYAIIRSGESGKEAPRDAQLRREAFEAAGLRAKEVAEASADSTRADAQAKTASLLGAAASAQIEAFLCGNDETALGAAQALKDAGLLKTEGDAAFVPVIGIDGSPAAIKAIEEGSLLGTLSGDPERQGKAAFSIALILAQGLDPNKAGWALDAGRFVFVPYKKVTKENCKLFEN
jgi:methyl-galactoside transport system substrate-binding protein